MIETENGNIRTFEELNEDEQTQAIDKCYVDLLLAVTEGAIRFNDELNGDSLQATIDAAGAKSEAMRTPWFASEYIAEASYSWNPGDGEPMSETVGEHLRGMARCTAEDAIYPDASVIVIELRAVKA